MKLNPLICCLSIVFSPVCSTGVKLKLTLELGVELNSGIAALKGTWFELRGTDIWRSGAEFKRSASEFKGSRSELAWILNLDRVEHL